MGIITAYPDKSPAADGDKYLTVADDGSTKLTSLDTIRDGVLTPGSVDSDTLAQSAKPQFKVGIIPANTFGTTGNKVISGVGFKPRFYRLEVMPSSALDDLYVSSGSTDGTTQQWEAVAAGVTNRARQSGNDAVIARINQGNTVSMKASHVSMNDDGFTINVIAANNAFDVAYEAFA